MLGNHWPASFAEETEAAEVKEEERVLPRPQLSEGVVLGMFFEQKLIQVVVRFHVMPSFCVSDDSSSIGGVPAQGRQSAP